MRTIDIHEAKANLLDLIERAARGHSFLIAISGTPRVMVLPLDSREAAQLRRIGLLKRCLVAAEALDPGGEGDVERRLADEKLLPEKVEASAGACGR